MASRRKGSSKIDSYGKDGGLTPRHHLARLKVEQAELEDAVRRRILEAMLRCCGESGFRRLSVSRVYQASGASRSQFYRHFPNKASCFAAAYGEEVDRLSDELIVFAQDDRTPGRQRLERALEYLARYLESKPLRARAVVLEVHVAGGEALERRRAAIDRLREVWANALCGTADSAAQLAAEFMICAVDHALATALTDPDAKAFRDVLPALVDLISRACPEDAPG